MRKMKKIITLAMTLVMMMAMSMTAFAAPTQPQALAGTTITIEKLVKDATVKVYKIATVYDNNTVTVESWADGAIDKTASLTQKTMTEDEVKAITAAFIKEKPAAMTLADGDVEATEAEKTKDVVIKNLPAGAYYITAASDSVTYATMVAVTFGNDGKGNYKASEPVKFAAKGEGNSVEKKADNKLVKAGDTVPFTIKTTIPVNAASFAVFDKTENLSSLAEVADLKVTIGQTDVTGNLAFAAVANETNLFKLDLTSLLATPNYRGQQVVITYTATVLGDKGYVNTAYDSTPNSVPSEVKGFTAKVDLLKVKQGDNNTTLPGAHFKLTKYDSKTQTYVALVFAETNDGYKLAESTDTTTTEDLVTNANGKILVTGLDEGTYKFVETEAPANYSINANIPEFAITEPETALTDHITVPVTVEDPQLISLPFTGGMGTTIFTILGVAIMAMAAALFFATKKSR